MNPQQSSYAGPDDVDELRRLAPAPYDVLLSDQDRSRLERRIGAGIIAERSREAKGAVRRSRARALAGPVLVAACLAAVLGLALTGRAGSTGPAAQPSAGRPADGPVGRPVGRPVVASAAAVTVLDAMSSAALQGGAEPVRDDQFVYVRSEVISNEGRLGEGPSLGAPHEREIWLTQDPDASGSDGSVIREFGQDWPIDYAVGVPAGLDRPTYAWLASLPTDPDDLLRELEGQVRGSAGQEPDQTLFDRIGDLLRESVLPPRTAAALYKGVSRIPGVTLEEGATDALGRVGTGITREDTVFHTRSVWVFETGTDRLLGTRDYVTGSMAGGGELLFNATAVVQRGVADAVGEAPGTPPGRPDV